MRAPVVLTAIVALLWPMISGCAAHDGAAWQAAVPVKATPATLKLQNLPAAGQRVAIAVYNFSDQTGQFKPTEGVQTLSRAVTQGSTSILVKALQEAGGRNWFTVIERERLDNILRERAVIREMRSAYLGEKKLNPQALPPLMFAGILLEGGIIGYDSNTKTGGVGARFLGIGGDTKYREDTVTIYLRAVSVKTGEVLTNVSVRKSIASVGVGASAFRYVAFKELLELESGFTFNEPDALAMQQAIEEAVYGMIMEGALQRLWCFSTTPEASGVLLTRYIAQRDGLKDRDVNLPPVAGGGTLNGSCATQQTARRLPLPPRAPPVAPGHPSGPAPTTAIAPVPTPQALIRNAAKAPIAPLQPAIAATPGGVTKARSKTYAPTLYAPIMQKVTRIAARPVVIQAMPARARHAVRQLTFRIPPVETIAPAYSGASLFCGQTRVSFFAARKTAVREEDRRTTARSS
jgi:curli production assembly/transport component CsgG